MGRAKPTQRWQRESLRLLKRLRVLSGEVARVGTPEQVHDFRVALRRFRLMLRLARPLLDSAKRRRFDNWARRAAEVSGPLRDLDVAVEWVNTCPRRYSHLESWLRTQRGSIYLVFKKFLKLKRMPLGRGLCRLEGKRTEERLATRLAKQESRLRDAVRDGIERFMTMPPEHRHDFRRQARRWRYLREFTLVQEQWAKDPLWRCLFKLQEAIGNQRNLSLAVEVLNRFPEDPAVSACTRRASTEAGKWGRRAELALRRLARVVRRG